MLATLLHVNSAIRSSMVATSVRADADPLLDSLYELIRTGELSPGQRVDQRAMSERLEVSRTPLREALRAMATDGVLVRTPNAGYEVAKLSAADLLQYYSIRTFLETEVLRSLVWPDAEQLAALKEANEECRAAANDVTIDRLVSSNRTFHLMMFSWSPLTVMYKEILRVWRVSEPYRVLHLSNPDRRRRVAADHDKMIAAIEAQDAKKLVRLMDEHRGRSRNLLQDMLGSAITPALVSLPQDSRRARQSS
ncbi:GntR family transcriptional regulator [Streptomyces sp. NPDC005799]|uniref:GntR family transcriptional regulator n=1 Tax=Streptomyces sp. NPDC005799 TaxID=3154678 RepID=UPI0033DE5917